MWCGSMDDRNETLEKPPVVARLRASLALRQITVTAWAKQKGFHPAQVWKAASGERDYPHIVQAIAAEIGEEAAELFREIELRKQVA